MFLGVLLLLSCVSAIVVERNVVSILYSITIIFPFNVFLFFIYCPSFFFTVLLFLNSLCFIVYYLI